MSDDIKDKDGINEETNEKPIVEEVQENAINNEPVKEGKEDVPAEVNEQKKDGTSKKIFVLSFLGLVLALISLCGFLIFCHIEDQMADNTVLIKDKINQSIHYVDLYEVTKEEGYLIYLYGELKDLDTLMDQTSRLGVSYPSLNVVYEQGIVQQVIANELDSIENSIKNKENANEVDLYVFRHRLETALGATKYTDSYKGFIHASNYAILCHK